jgi:branched-chain amino acid transport system permease protein
MSEKDLEPVPPDAFDVDRPKPEEPVGYRDAAPEIPERFGQVRGPVGRRRRASGMPAFVLAAIALVLVGALFAMLLAVPIGWLSVRRSGIYFAMVTLAFAQMIYFVANRWRSLTGGENGLQAVPTNFFGLDAVESQPFWFYYSALPLLVLAALGAWRIVHSPFGRVLVAIRDNPDRARALGYDVEKYKVLAFVLSAGLSGVAGGLFTISHGFASLQEVSWQTSGKVVLVTVLGGIGTLWGALAGSAVVVNLEDQLATSGFNGTGIILGAIFIVVVLLERLLRRRRP